MNNIGIICAMPEEAELIVDALGLQPSSEGSLGDMALFTRSSIQLIVPGIGPVNAALAVACLHSRGVKTVVNCGLAGSLDSSKLAIGDVCLANTVQAHDRYVPFPGYEYYTGASQLNPSITAVADAIEVPQARVLTGSQFVHNGISAVVPFEQLAQMGDAIEMEAMGVLNACRAFGLEDPYILKAISDHADGSAETDFMDSIRLAMQNSIPAVEALIREVG